VMASAALARKNSRRFMGQASSEIVPQAVSLRETHVTKTCGRLSSLRHITPRFSSFLGDACASWVTKSKQLRLEHWLALRQSPHGVESTNFSWVLPLATAQPN